MVRITHLFFVTIKCLSSVNYLLLVMLIIREIYQEYVENQQNLALIK